MIFPMCLVCPPPPLPVSFREDLNSITFPFRDRGHDVNIPVEGGREVGNRCNRRHICRKSVLRCAEFLVCGLDIVGSPSATAGFDLPGKVLVVEVCFEYDLTSQG